MKLDRSDVVWGIGGAIVSIVWLIFARPALAKIPSGK